MSLLFTSLQQSQLSRQTRVARRSCAPSNDAPISGRHVSQRGYNPDRQRTCDSLSRKYTDSIVHPSFTARRFPRKTLARRSKMPVLPAPPLHDKAPFVVLSDWVSIAILSSSGRN